MEALFKKHFWVVKLAGIGVVVAFAASAFTTWLGTGLLLDAEAAAMPIEDMSEEDEEDEEDDPTAVNLAGTTSNRATASGKQNTAKSIVQRNPFCPTCAPPIDDEGGGIRPVVPGEIKSSLPLVLLATMEADDPMFSMATIMDTEKNALGPFSITENIRPNVKIERIEDGRVILRNGAQLEYIEVGDDAPPPPKVKPTVKAQDPSPKKNSRVIEGAADAINCDGDTCSVDREFVEQILDNPAKLAKQARVVPAVRDGETRGFKFYGIRPGTLPKLLGLKNGDLVTSVNGHELKSLDGAMALYSKLRRANHLSVVVERKGETLNKEIDIK